MSKMRGRGGVGLLSLIAVITLTAGLIWHSNILPTDRGKMPNFMMAEASDSPVKAPNFELQDLDGTKIRLDQFKGKEPVLLYFWATWCPSCNAVKPRLIEMRNDIKQDELVILGINVGENDSLERVKRFQKAHPVPFPILYDTDSEVSRKYHVRGIPLFVLIDKDGKIVYLDNSPPENIRKYLGR